MAWSPHAFLNVHRNDVEASFRALAETVGRRRGYLVHTINQICETSDALDAVVRAGAFDLLLIDAPSYLGLTSTNGVAPRFTSTDGGLFGKRYALFVHAKDGPARLADLRGSSLGIFEQANTSLGRFWLDVTLQDAGIPKHGVHFGKVTSCAKPSAAALPVFFGKSTACVIDQDSFDVLSELNPQIGKSLRLLVQSERLIDGFVCVRTTPWASEKFRKDLEATLLDFHAEPGGRQILSLIKARQLVPFHPTQLEATRQLFRRLHGPPPAAP